MTSAGRHLTPATHPLLICPLLSTPHLQDEWALGALNYELTLGRQLGGIPSLQYSAFLLSVKNVLSLLHSKLGAFVTMINYPGLGGVSGSVGNKWRCSLAVSTLGKESVIGER